MNLLIVSLVMLQTVISPTFAADQTIHKKADNLICKVNKARGYDPRTSGTAGIVTDYLNGKREPTTGVFKFKKFNTKKPQVLGDGLYLQNDHFVDLEKFGNDGNRVWLLSDDGKNKRIFQIVFFEKNEIAIHLYFLPEREFTPPEHADLSYFGKCSPEK